MRPLCGLALLALFPQVVRPQIAAPRAGAVVPGVEVLLTDSLHLVVGKRVGLITNHSGRDRKGTSTIDLLFRVPGVRLVALFGPEHGLRGVAQAGEKVASTTDPATGVPVFSLYGDVQVPTPAMLKNVDVLVYDIQDVGARVYTFEWTMALAAKAANLPFIVLDRPDPIRADRVEGNILDPKYASFVGQFPVALRYGLTAGELLRYLVGTGEFEAQVTVVPMKGYQRSMWYDETGIPWVTPSPNLRNLDAALLYTMTVFFEGTNVSEGRGTDDPFAQVGASWLTDAGAIAAELNGMRLPGLRFDSTSRQVQPGFKFGGQTIPMVRVQVIDRNMVRAAESGVRLLRAIYARHAKDWQWNERQFDRLAGSDELRAAVEHGTLEALVRKWHEQARSFEAKRRPFLIY